jgi:hypothetical protein
MCINEIFSLSQCSTPHLPRGCLKTTQHPSPPSYCLACSTGLSDPDLDLSSVLLLIHMIIRIKRTPINETEHHGEMQEASAVSLNSLFCIMNESIWTLQQRRDKSIILLGDFE